MSALTVRIARHTNPYPYGQSLSISLGMGSLNDTLPIILNLFHRAVGK